MLWVSGCCQSNPKQSAAPCKIETLAIGFNSLLGDRVVGRAMRSERSWRSERIRSEPTRQQLLLSLSMVNSLDPTRNHKTKLKTSGSPSRRESRENCSWRFSQSIQQDNLDDEVFRDLCVCEVRAEIHSNLHEAIPEFLRVARKLQRQHSGQQKPASSNAS